MSDKITQEEIRQELFDYRYQSRYFFIFIISIFSELAFTSIILASTHQSDAFFPVMLPFALSLAVVLLSIRLGVNERLKDILSAHRKFRWDHVVIPFAAVTVCSIIAFLIEMKDYRFIGPFFSTERLIMFLMVMVLTPLQCAYEEITFRIIPCNFLCSHPFGIRHRWILATVMGALFLGVHLLNPEIKNAENILPMIYVFLFGFIATWLSLRYASFWISISMHTANNLFVFLFAGYEGASVNALPLFMKSGSDVTIISIMVLAVSAAISVFCLERRR